jgi:hypothetical protein
MRKKSAFPYSIFCSLFGFSLLLFSTIVNADKLVELPPIETHGVSLQLRAITGMANYEYQDIFLQNDVGDNIFLGGFGTRFNYDHFFADIYYQKSNTANEHALIGGNNHSSINFSRRDWAITTGYTFLENTFLGDVSAFGGYKSGKTSLNTIQTIQPETTSVMITTELETHFETKDYFLGLANSWRIKGGFFGFNAIAAYLGADYKSAVLETNIGTIGRVGEVGKTIRNKFGLNWSYPINNRLAYAISLEYYDYTLDVEAATKETSFSVDEQLYGLKASLIYSFDL